MATTGWGQTALWSVSGCADCPDILSRLLGACEATIRSLLSEASARFDQVGHGQCKIPCWLIFLGFCFVSVGRCLLCLRVWYLICIPVLVLRSCGYSPVSFLIELLRSTARLWVVCSTCLSTFSLSPSLPFSLYLLLCFFRSIFVSHLCSLAFFISLSLSFSLSLSLSLSLILFCVALVSML